MPDSVANCSLYNKAFFIPTGIGLIFISFFFILFTVLPLQSSSSSSSTVKTCCCIDSSPSTTTADDSATPRRECNRRTRKGEKNHNHQAEEGVAKTARGRWRYMTNEIQSGVSKEEIVPANPSLKSELQEPPRRFNPVSFHYRFNPCLCLRCGVCFGFGWVKLLNLSTLNHWIASICRWTHVTNWTDDAETRRNPRIHEHKIDDHGYLQENMRIWSHIHAATIKIDYRAKFHQEAQSYLWKQFLISIQLELDAVLGEFGIQFTGRLELHFGNIEWALFVTLKCDDDVDEWRGEGKNFWELNIDVATLLNTRRVQERITGVGGITIGVLSMRRRVREKLVRSF